MTKIPYVVAGVGLALSTGWLGCRSGSHQSASTAPSARQNAADTRAPAEFLAWVRPKKGSKAELTAWIRSNGDGFELEGTAPGVLVAAGSAIWRWQTKESKLRTRCSSAEVPPDVIPKDAETDFVGAEVENVAGHERLALVEPEVKELQCLVYSDSTVELLGSVGPFLFVSSSHYENGGGAHGISVEHFSIWNLDTNQEWDTWQDEIKVSDSEQQSIRKKMGDGSEETKKQLGGTPAVVSIEPGKVVPSYPADGKLSLRVCFTVEESNVPEHAPAMARGKLWALDCGSGSVPYRLTANAVVPPSVMRFVLSKGFELGGWSALPPAGAARNALKAIIGAHDSGA